MTNYKLHFFEGTFKDPCSSLSLSFSPSTRRPCLFRVHSRSDSREEAKEINRPGGTGGGSFRDSACVHVRARKVARCTVPVELRKMSPARLAGRGLIPSYKTLDSVRLAAASLSVAHVWRGEHDASLRRLIYRARV